MQQASPFSQHPSQASASPFQVGGSPLFRTAAQEAVAAPPINSSQGMSPFNIAGATSTSTPLTVGDVIGQLPPEIVRAGALPLEQPLALPPTLLENALRGGQPALPVFELYRVCPALFQTPVSPQDPRMVALPPSKLPALIAKAREGHGRINGGGMPPGSSAAFATPLPAAAAGVPASPFSAVEPAGGGGTGVASPFSAMPASPFSAASSPAAAAAAPSPFGMAGQQGGASAGSPFQATSTKLDAAASGAGAAFPMSPFAGGGLGFSEGTNGSANGNGKAHGLAPAASAFSLGRTAETPVAKAAPGVFSLAPEATPSSSPFGMPPVTPQQSGGITSLFTPKSQEGASSPAAAAPSAFGAPGAGGSLLGGASFGSPPVGGSLFATPQVEAAAVPGPTQALSSTPVSASAAVQQGSPFAFQPAASAPQGGAASPFGAAPAPAAGGGASPFGAAPAPAAGTAGISFDPPQAAQPAPATAASSTPGAPGFASALAFGSPPPGSMPQGFGSATGTGSGSGQAKLSFAAVLHGFSADDLGFNPAMVPAWITSQLPISTLKDQISSGTVMVELGALIDGLTDVGFRNTLSTAKRGLQIKLPQNEVFHALTGAAPATPSAPLGAFATSKTPLQPAAAAGGLMGGSGAFVIQPGAPAGQVSRVEPGGQGPAAASAPGAAASPSFFTGGPSAGSAFSGTVASPFGSGPASFSQAGDAASAEPPAAPAPDRAPPVESRAFGAPAPSSLFSGMGQSGAASAPAPAPATPFMGTGGSAPVAPGQPALLSAFGAAPAASSAPTPFSFPQAPAAAPASMPLAGIVKPLGGAAVSAFGSPPPPASAPATSSLGMVNKPFDPFAATGSHTGVLTGGAPAAAASARPSPAEAGLSSAQLLGQSSGLPAAASMLPAFSTPPVLQPRPADAAPAPSSAFASPFGPPPAAAVPAAPERERAQPAFVPASFAPALEARPVSGTPSIPLFSEPAPGQTSAPAASRPLFGEVRPASPGAAANASPAPAFGFASTPASAIAPASPSPAFAPVASLTASAPTKTGSAPGTGAGGGGKHSFLGLAPLDTQTDQLLLRALLATEENLTAQRVVELLAAHPGLSACVCLQGSQVLSHADKSKPDAAEFQRQAPDIARQLRALAPLIGIEGAETFTLNAGNRLLTFCFPGNTTVGVLHVEEPSTGLRDKITLIARELARMLG